MTIFTSQFADQISRFISDRKFCCAVSLATNYRDGASPLQMRVLLRDWHGLVEVEVLGKYFHKRRRRGQRIISVSFFEKLHRNAHVHMLMRLPECPKRRSALTEKLMQRCWQTLVPSGSVVKVFASNPRDWVAYCAKTFPVIEGDEPVFSFEFWPA